ncbi:MAG: DUF4845 domain-containing protein [Gammaproteobacteria bacterium]|nr:DUF4845 domain-containing protein [Gammaproteobacteria bacterium]
MLKKQKGLTAISWIIVLGIVGVQAMLALRVIPIYLNDESIKSVMQGLETDSTAAGETPKQIRELINRRLSINGISEFENNKEAFKFKKTTSGMDVTLNYEKRGPIFGNLEFVATFEHKIKIPNR